MTKVFKQAVEQFEYQKGKDYELYGLEIDEVSLGGILAHIKILARNIESGRFETLYMNIYIEKEGARI